MRILALVTDAFGGHGGIAQYNRDLLTAVCEYPDCTEVLALPRLMHHQRDPLPAKLTYSLKGLGGRFKYAMALLRILFQRQRVDLVICCHINLLPLAWLAAKLKSAPLVLTIFGIDAWQATRNRLIPFSIHSINIERHTGESRYPVFGRDGATRHLDSGFRRNDGVNFSIDLKLELLTGLQSA